MRPIKFRGKRIDNNEWVYGSLLILDYHDSVDYVNSCQIVLTNGHSFDVHPETVGEYSGLLDKNGKEIYESDIVKDNKDGAVALVLYTPPCFVCKIKLDSEEYFRLGADKVYPDGWKLVDTEVIGNIYEHPELLKEDK